MNVDPWPKATLEEKVNMLASLVVLLARRLEEPDRTIVEAADELDHTYVISGYFTWLRRRLRYIWRATKSGLESGEVNPSFWGAVTGELLREELTAWQGWRGSDGVPLHAHIRERFASLHSLSGPLKIPLIGLLHLTARLRAMGYPRVDGFLCGLIDQSAVDDDK